MLLIAPQCQTPVPTAKNLVLDQQSATKARRNSQSTTHKDDELALLDNAQVRQSRQVFRQYRSGAWGATHFDAIMPSAEDIPCVEVLIPQADWQRIEQLILAHERGIKNPAVQDAWDQYLMLRHLTDPNLPKR